MITRYFLVLYGFLVLFSPCFITSEVITREFLAVTQQDLDKAKANPPVMQGIPVNTIAGAQLTPIGGVMPKEIDRNQQIFNDIDRLRFKMLDFMNDVTQMAIRYNKYSEFELVKKRLSDSMQQIEAEIRSKLSR